MEEQAQKLVNQETTRNAGWFRAGDTRINREGRPKGSKPSASAENVSPVCASITDRVKLLFVCAPDLAFRLSHQNAPWLVNLPHDVEIVDCRMDRARNGLVLTIRSPAFPRVAKGAVVPDFEPAFNGLKWSR